MMILADVLVDEKKMDNGVGQRKAEKFLVSISALLLFLTCCVLPDGQISSISSAPLRS